MTQLLLFYQPWSFRSLIDIESASRCSFQFLSPGYGLSIAKSNKTNTPKYQSIGRKLALGLGEQIKLIPWLLRRFC